jgi:hypothetical protein
MNCIKGLQRFWQIAGEAGFASRMATRGVFALFLFFCVISSPGLAQVVIAAVPPMTEEQHETRESLVMGSAVRTERQSAPSLGLCESIPEPQRPRPASTFPVGAHIGHRLANGLCAPLLR